MLVEELRQSVTHIHGLGAKRASDLSRLGIETIADLLLHCPRNYEDRKTRRTFTEALAESRGGPVPEGTANTEIEVLGHEYFGRPGRQTLKVRVRDESSSASLLCFGRDFLARTLTPGAHFRLFARVKYEYGEVQSSSFEFERISDPGATGATDASEEFGYILPIYPLAGSLNQKVLRKAVRDAYQQYGRHVDELVHNERRHVWQLHFPDALKDAAEARSLLAQRELFGLQLLSVHRARQRHALVRPARPVPTGLQSQLMQSLPFALTDDQTAAIEDLNRDLSGSYPMARLLQGDVGCGKTLVALCAALAVIEAGGQVAFMVPTELLARQQADRAAELMSQLPVRIGLLRGKDDAQAQEELRRRIATGELDLIIGTHALFSDRTIYANLRMVIVDEQHRFGVKQRARLLEKGHMPDWLMMSATPIPRTMALSAFGDMDVTSIRTAPLHRAGVVTHLARHGNEEKVYRALQAELDAGHQAYVVYPAIEGGSGLRSAEGMLKTLQARFPAYRAEALHSRVEEAVREQRMERFRSGEVSLLVATSIVEVGVDVPNASVIVIDHAERFGLAALHQMRGRVGRGGAQGYAFLMYDPELTDLGKQRLKLLLSESDGFEIAEQDLQMRGPGDISGLRQAGYLRLRVADLARDGSLLVSARRQAEAVFGEDPELRAHDAERRLLELLIEDSQRNEPVTA